MLIIPFFLLLILFHSVTQSVNTFTYSWPFGLFLFFCYYEYLCTSRACILFSWEWGVEWLDHVVGVIKCFLSILRKCQAVIKVVIPYFIPTSLVWEFHCFYILSNPWDGQSFLFCSSNGWVMVSHFGFKLFFPVTDGVKHFSCV